MARLLATESRTSTTIVDSLIGSRYGRLARWPLLGSQAVERDQQTIARERAADLPRGGTSPLCSKRAASDTKSADHGSYILSFLNVSPLFDSLRPHERFAALRRAVRLG